MNKSLFFQIAGIVLVVGTIIAAAFFWLFFGIGTFPTAFFALIASFFVGSYQATLIGYITYWMMCCGIAYYILKKIGIIQIPKKKADL